MRPPQVIAVASAGQGTRQRVMALGIGAAIRRAGKRVAVIETDLEQGCLAAVAGLRAGPCLADVLADRLTLAEAVVDGPDGIGLVAGAQGGSNQLGPFAQRGLLEQIDRLGHRFDVFVIVPAADLSTGTLFVVGAAHATAVILQPGGVADPATLKTLGVLARRVDQALGVVVHGAADAASAGAEFTALLRATTAGPPARLAYLGWVPAGPEATVAAWTPFGPASRALAELVAPWCSAPPARPRGGLQFFFEPLLAAGEAA
jgi:MinD-like ATPase involved in chromosome partitioning or flagellar assembly